MPGFKIGILIIGSLYWDESQCQLVRGQCQHYSRKSWRQARLNMNDVSTVAARIRYGRRATTRGNTYTMIFSRSAKPGTAKVVRCLNDVQDVKGLLEEAIQLWTAEKNGDNVGRMISSEWGCVGLLSNPSRQQKLNGLTEAWQELVSSRQAEQGNYRNFEYPAKEKRAMVTNSGLLDIDWPTLGSGKELDFDFLLATANYPVPIEAPTAKEIGMAWRKSPYFVNYFYANYMNNIRTFQDNAIAAIVCPIR